MPWDVNLFLARLSAHRGRSITLTTADLDPHAPCGIYLGLADSDIIVVPAQSGTYHREHVLAHEIAHMLFDSEAAGASPSPVDPEFARALFPDIPHSLITALLGRQGYGTRVERRAELFAEMLQERIHEGDTETEPPAATPTMSEEQQQIAARLARALGHSRRKK